MDWKKKYADKVRTPEEAARLVKSGDKVVIAMFLHPVSTCLALAKRREELRGVTILSHWQDEFPWFQPGWEDSFKVQSGFILRPAREGHREKRFDFVPSLFGLSNGVRQREQMRGKIYPDADVFILKVTPPNRNGWCSFGHHVWYSDVAARTAKIVIAEVDPNLVWTYGAHVHVSDLDYLVEGTHHFEVKGIGQALPTPPADEAETSQVIGCHIAGLIRDGDTLEIGTGTAAEAVMQFLCDKNDLGIDSEMMYVQMINLIKAGNITGKKNNIHPGKYVTTCLFTYPGDPRARVALDYINHNPHFRLYDVSRICNVPRIASVDNMVSINNGLAIDLNGQVVISHLGSRPISGPGGQVEYTIGSHYSKGGRCFLALLSTAKGGTVSRIVPQLDPGTVVLIPNVYVDYLVTEHGIVNLDCKTDRERAEAIISVAHPDFRPELRKAARKMFYP